MNEKILLAFNEFSHSPPLFFFPPPPQRLAPKCCTLQLSLCKPTNELQEFLCVQLWSVIITTSGLDGEVLHREQPSITHSRPFSNHAASRRPTAPLAAEQGAAAGLKIKCATSGFHSQELHGLMLY